MRQAFLATVLALAACGSPSAPSAAEPAPTPGETAMKRLFSVDSIDSTCVGGVVTLTVAATANSGGWGEPVLNRLGREGDTVSYEIVATAPDGPATMMMQPFTITHRDADIRGVASVRVSAASNDLTAKLTRCGS